MSIPHKYKSEKKNIDYLLNKYRFKSLLKKLIKNNKINKEN